MKWAVIEEGVITNIYEGPEPPDSSHLIPDGLDPFKISWDGENIVAKEHSLSDEEAAGVNRDLRNKKLSDSDWTQLPDAPAATKDAWIAYRQFLRDLPDHVNWPHLNESDWPALPEG